MQRWCIPTDLELLRTSPRKAARVSVIVGRALSKTLHRPGINSYSGSDSDLELAPHEKGRELAQVLRGTGTGMGTAHGNCVYVSVSLLVSIACALCVCVLCCVGGGGGGGGGGQRCALT